MKAVFSYFLILSVFKINLLTSELQNEAISKDERGFGIVKLAGDAPAVAANSNTVNSNNVTCVEKGCINIASLILDNMDETVDPCDDFYSFTCGGYVNRTVIPDGEFTVSVISSISDQLNERIRQLLEQKPRENESKTVNMTKTLYNTCMNETKIDAQGALPLRHILTELGGWPVLELEAWEESNFSPIEVLYRIHDLGFATDSLFSFDVDVSEKNSSLRTIALYQPELGIDREELVKGLNSSAVQAYLRYATKIAEILGSFPDVANEEMSSALLLEIQLANISSPRDDSSESSPTSFTVLSMKEMEDLTPSVPWYTFINKLLPSSVKIAMDEKVVVYDQSYFSKFTNIIQKFNRRTIANYIIWRVIQQAAPYLTHEISDVELETQSATPGGIEPVPRWETCVRLVQEKLPYGVGNLYVNTYFRDNHKEQLTLLVKHIKNSFSRMMKSVGWMSDSTKRIALEKYNKIQYNVAYPNELFSNTVLDDYYKNLTIDGHSLLDDVRRINLFTTDFERSQLRKEVDKSDWKNYASVSAVDASFDNERNSIELPTGLLHGILFDPSFPPYVNFAGIGMILIQEIIHGFDEEGMKYDIDGNLNSWWDPQTQLSYSNASKCIINQYSQFDIPEIGLKLNGQNSREDIADNGATEAAYRAYQDWIHDSPQEQQLPGLKYNHNQLFWISLAQKMCERSRAEYAQQQVSDGDTPYKFRINGPLVNSPEFANDFHCLAGSKMNPTVKCTVW